MVPKWELILPILMAVVAVAGLIWTYFGGILGLKDEIARIVKTFGESNTKYEARFVALETKMELFWGAVGKVVIDMVKQPIHYEKDALLDRLKSNSINGEELVKLKYMMEEEVQELKEKRDARAVAYVLILAMIDQKLWEKNCECKEESKRT